MIGVRATVSFAKTGFSGRLEYDPESKQRAEMVVGNTVLFAWPVVMVVLFATLSRPMAISVSLVLGYLLLPEVLYFDLPILPTLNKHSIPAIAALVFVVLTAGKYTGTRLAGWLPKLALPRFLLMMLIFSSFLTVMTNSDPVVYATFSLRGLQPYDAFSITLSLLVSLIPFFLARKYLATPEQHKMLLAVIAIAAFAYSFLALFEVRMSPQLSQMIYGFFAHSFDQHIRNGGFRPIVFLQHGLFVAIFFAMAIAGAFSLARAAGGTIRARYIAVGVWLLLTLSLSNSLGALMIAVVLLPVVLLCGTRVQLLICAVIAVVVLLYPTLRGADLVPVDAIVAWAEGVNPNRAQSLAFRIMNEDLLLARAQERPIFGWGAFARNMVLSDNGVNLAVTDGYWVIIIGQGGWMRYLSEFGLMCTPVIVAAYTFRKYRFGFETTGLIILLVANLVDLLPNATTTPLTWLVVGAVWGRIELGRIAEVEEDEPALSPRHLGPVYTRFAQPVAGRVGPRAAISDHGAARNRAT